MVGIFLWFVVANNREWREYLRDRNAKLEAALVAMGQAQGCPPHQPPERHARPAGFPARAFRREKIEGVLRPDKLRAARRLAGVLLPLALAVCTVAVAVWLCSLLRALEEETAARRQAVEQLPGAGRAAKR